MGVYAETNFEIECENKKVASEVLKVLEAKTNKSDENGNSFGQDLSIDGNVVLGFEDSGRVQNLLWRCEQIWEAIKDIKGVISFSASVMEESDSIYYENEK